MTSLNTMKFVSNSIEKLTEYKMGIANADTYEKAKKIANTMLGYIDCLITFNNTMICMENNDFTGDFGEVIDQWQAVVYQSLVNKATETKQDHDLIFELLKKRDEILGK